MEQNLKYSKIAAWSGIILNVLLLLMVCFFGIGYQDAEWVKSVLVVMRYIAYLANILMLGGLFSKCFIGAIIKKVNREK